MRQLSGRGRRGVATFDMLSLLLVSGLAAGAFWPQRDPVQRELDRDARAVMNALLDGRRTARLAAKPMLVELEPIRRIVHVAVDRNGDGLIARGEVVHEVTLGDDVMFGLPESMTSRPFGAEGFAGRITKAGTVVLRLETSDKASLPSGFYLATSRALRSGTTHDEEVLSIELAGATSGISTWRPGTDGEWARRF